MRDERRGDGDERTEICAFWVSRGGSQETSPSHVGFVARVALRVEALPAGGEFFRNDFLSVSFNRESIRGVRFFEEGGLSARGGGIWGGVTK